MAQQEVYSMYMNEVQAVLLLLSTLSLPLVHSRLSANGILHFPLCAMIAHDCTLCHKVCCCYAEVVCSLLPLFQLL
jgi:hypothetical protein